MKWKLFMPSHPPPLDYVPAPPEVPPQQEVEIDAMSMRQPYHEEDTGSLVLHTRDGTFHCFGCGAEGEIKKIVAVLERK